MALLNDLKTIHFVTYKQYWITVGEFNIIASLVEKQGGIKKLDEYIKAFQSIIKDFMSQNFHWVTMA